MTVPRIYSPVCLTDSPICELGRDNWQYLKQVLRLQPGDKINIFDGFGNEHEAIIKSFAQQSVSLELKERITNIASGIRITLAQALPKAGKMDMIVREAAELCISRIIPFAAERSVSKIDKDKAPLKVARWQKITQEAARCCRSAGITEVAAIASYKSMLARADDAALKLIFWEEESQTTIKDVLTAKSNPGSDGAFIIVGPEGGLTRDEVAQACAAGFTSVSLGRHILKVETAAAAIISIIQYEKGIFSNAVEVR
ncbi:MAG TPA: RsmE family RNA methyltransferase [Smithellaceae bacterium]|nr:RsmE family RNA methyltransferase [Smithellaceae bacterium]